MFTKASLDLSLITTINYLCFHPWSPSKSKGQKCQIKAYLLIGLINLQT